MVNNNIGYKITEFWKNEVSELLLKIYLYFDGSSFQFFFFSSLIIFQFKTKTD